MARITEVRKTGIGNSSVVVTIDKVHNSAVVSLNGVELAELETNFYTNPPTFQTYTENITNKLQSGCPNVLVITLANHDLPGHDLPRSVVNRTHISGKVNVGSEEINISATGNAPQGIFSQTTIILEK